MDAITHTQRYTRRAKLLISVCLIISVSILQGPTSLSWADDPVSSAPGLAPVPSEQPKSTSFFVPLPSGELEKLNSNAQSAVIKSPVRIKAVIDIHHAKIDAKEFASLAARSVTIGAPISFQLSSKGPPVTVVTDRLEQGLEGTLEWDGHVPGDPNSSVHLIVNIKASSVFGDIRVGGRLYEISLIGSGTHTIYTLDLKRLPPDHPPNRQARRPRRVEESPMPAGSDYPRPIADKGESISVKLAQRPHAQEGSHTEQGDIIFVGLPQIDVMVLYTTSAANQAREIGTQVCLAMKQMTTALVKSGVQATVRLVHHGELNYNEAGYTDPTRLGNLNNILDEIRTLETIKNLRRDYGADVVSFWVSDNVGAGTACGLSPILSPPEPSNWIAAYSVVLRSCATANLSFAHELGHLLGANHDRFADSASNSPKYNWGFVNPKKSWRTVMAYDRSDCHLGSCVRLEYWSNPTVLHHGDATGCSQTSDDPSACDGPANNKRALDNAAPIVANFRPSAHALGNVSCPSE